jgi:Putative 2OG-Fe(II) oxygenase
MVPRNGRMVLFPAGLMHSVEKYEGDRPRITIAFNLHHSGFEVPRLVHRERAANWMWSNFRGIMMLKSKLPEKAVGLCLIRRVLASTPMPKPASFAAIRQYVATAISHSFALASERFEKLDGSD